ncbi:MAG: hypothetical protein U5P41_05660 [Gammaproteobacteria bacterium]|nr:hypothetical protein [Gammaproteobacteria bacterium]
MQDGAARLHAAIVATADDPVVVDQDRSDRNAALGEADAGFFNRGLHELIHAFLRSDVCPSPGLTLIAPRPKYWPQYMA